MPSAIAVMNFVVMPVEIKSVKGIAMDSSSERKVRLVRYGSVVSWSLAITCHLECRVAARLVRAGVSQVCLRPEKLGTSGFVAEM